MNYYSLCVINDTYELIENSLEIVYKQIIKYLKNEVKYNKVKKNKYNNGLNIVQLCNCLAAYFVKNKDYSKAAKMLSQSLSTMPFEIDTNSRLSYKGYNYDSMVTYTFDSIKLYLEIVMHLFERLKAADLPYEEVKKIEKSFTDLNVTIDTLEKYSRLVLIYESSHEVSKKIKGQGLSLYQKYEKALQEKETAYHKKIKEEFSALDSQGFDVRENRSGTLILNFPLLNRQNQDGNKNQDDNKKALLRVKWLKSHSMHKKKFDRLSKV